MFGKSLPLDIVCGWVLFSVLFCVDVPSFRYCTSHFQVCRVWDVCFCEEAHLAASTNASDSCDCTLFRCAAGNTDTFQHVLLLPKYAYRIY